LFAGNTVQEHAGELFSAGGYRQEPGVKKDSNVETFVAAKILIEQLALGRRPVLCSDGQATSEPRNRKSQFSSRRRPHLVFRGQDLSSNTMVLNVQARRRNFNFLPCKIARPGNEIENRDDEFSYQKEFGAGERSAYAT